MLSKLRIVLAQLNFLVGDIPGNARKVIDATKRARDELAAQLIVFPELALTAYPPEDLLLRADLYQRVREALASITAEVTGIDLIIGYPVMEHEQRFNVASLIRNGEIAATYYKQMLPNYAVFDERRYFSAGVEACVVDVAGIGVGITICEDLWKQGPVQQATEAGAQLLINLNASPYCRKKWQEREDVATERAETNLVPIVYVNQVGGQDELVFDGASFVVDIDGKIVARAQAFEEQLFPVDFNIADHPRPVSQALPEILSEEESIYRALALGVRDYVEKNHFPGVVIALSGGVDSALTLAIAVDALGPERVEVVMMPSPYTAPISVEDAQSEIEALGISLYRTIPITGIFNEILANLSEEFKGLPADITEENIQARVRGLLVMAISNKTGKMVLTTGNKSEMAVGYATLYGDMAGGFAAIKDVPKTMVYRLARYRNRLSPVIPERVLEREPSAELAPDQKDSDSLPPYEVLDPIIERYVEHDESAEEIVQAGFDSETVRGVIKMIDRNEYKRRQAPPGVRITPRAFGRDRRYPITSGFGSS